ncbi:MAG: ABC transporter ATP-binding protein [Nonomuraea sp.]|nr:ABC transporter ATP-binding protein [Nonomuraea sp.]
MPDITLTGVAKSYGSGPAAVRGLDLTIPDGAFTCLLGPSGCGKTTTLRMIAGLEHPTAGRLEVGGRVLDSVADGIYVPPEKRDMGLVFQNYALWPHLTVRSNVEFGLRMRKVPAPERRARAEEALRMVRVGDCMDRYPAQLSGGQQQRVSLARMLAVNPSVLLLDEPLSNLDAQLRLEMRAELKRIHEETGATIVFVTHDQLEAMTMATDVVVMNHGELQQVAEPMTVYSRPANRFVAEFVGSPPMNLVSSGALFDALASFAGVRAGSIGVRPEALSFEPRPGAWTAEAVVEAVLPTGSSWTVRLRILDTEVFAVSYGPTPGSTVYVDRAALHVFDPAGVRLAEVPA